MDRRSDFCHRLLPANRRLMELIYANAKWLYVESSWMEFWNYRLDRWYRLSTDRIFFSFVWNWFVYSLREKEKLFSLASFYVLLSIIWTRNCNWNLDGIAYVSRNDLPRSSEKQVYHEEGSTSLKVIMNEIIKKEYNRIRKCIGCEEKFSFLQYRQTFWVCLLVDSYRNNTWVGLEGTCRKNIMEYKNVLGARKSSRFCNIDKLSEFVCW